MRIHTMHSTTCRQIRIDGWQIFNQRLFTQVVVVPSATTGPAVGLKRWLVPLVGFVVIGERTQLLVDIPIPRSFQEF